MSERGQFDVVFEREQGWSDADRARADHVVDRLPEAARRILDAGCGTGTVAKRVAESGRDVTGMDLSTVAVGRVQDLGIACVQGSIVDIPFPDRSFDLVLACEVLEHLNESDRARAVLELGRVARRWILVTVPNRDHLPSLRRTCLRCSSATVPWGHLRSFDLPDLDALVPGFRAVRTERFGPGCADGWHPLTRLLRIPRALGEPLGAGMRCPVCGYLETRRTRQLLNELPIVRAGIQGLATLANLVEVRVAPRRPLWLLALYERVPEVEEAGDRPPA